MQRSCFQILFQVFSCVSALCGYFYHPECVSKLLYPENNAEAEVYTQKIFAGESFTCPAHQCSVCKELENKDVDELNFAVCRRCPKAYHRKCLPLMISRWPVFFFLISTVPLKTKSTSVRNIFLVQTNILIQ